MKDKCFGEKEKRDLLEIDIDGIIPFEYKLIKKKNHECILKKREYVNFQLMIIVEYQEGLLK